MHRVYIVFQKKQDGRISAIHHSQKHPPKNKYVLFNHNYIKYLILYSIKKILSTLTLLIFLSLASSVYAQDILKEKI